MTLSYITPNIEILEAAFESPLMSSFSDGDPIITPTDFDYDY